MEGSSSIQPEYTDSWENGKMRTQRVTRFSEQTIIHGEVNSGRYSERLIVRDQEITVLSGSVSLFQKGTDKAITFSKGEKFKLFQGRKYTFTFEGQFTFSCKYC